MQEAPPDEGVSVSEAAREFESASALDDVRAKLRTIQETFPELPTDALAAFIADLLQVPAKRRDDPDALDHLFADWHKRALFAKAQRERPTEPIRTSDDWEKLPDRSFG